MFQARLAVLVAACIVYTLHNMYVKVYEGKLLKCYIAVLSDAGKMSVHTDAGLRTAELKYLGMIDSATMVDKTGVSAGDVKECGHGHGKNGTTQYFNIM